MYMYTSMYCVYMSTYNDIYATYKYTSLHIWIHTHFVIFSGTSKFTLIESVCSSDRDAGGSLYELISTKELYQWKKNRFSISRRLQGDIVVKRMVMKDKNID
jgi:hypothetical protein